MKFENIDLFYDIYKYKTEDLNYHLMGVKSMIFMIKPNYNINIPLDPFNSSWIWNNKCRQEL